MYIGTVLRSIAELISKQRFEVVLLSSQISM